MLDEDVARLDVAMDDRVIVQVGDGMSDLQEPVAGLFRRQTLWIAIQDGIEWFAVNVFHHQPVIATFISLQVVQVNEIRVLEVQAIGDAAKLGVRAAAKEQFERGLFTAVGDGEVDLAEPTLAQATLDRVAIQRALAPSVGESQSAPGTRSVTPVDSLAGQGF